MYLLRVYSHTHAPTQHTNTHTYQVFKTSNADTHLLARYTHTFRVASISRLLKIIGLFCKRALQKRRYSAIETYDFKQPTNRSHPIACCVLHHGFTHDTPVWHTPTRFPKHETQIHTLLHITDEPYVLAHCTTFLHTKTVRNYTYTTYVQLHYPNSRKHTNTTRIRTSLHVTPHTHWSALYLLTRNLLILNYTTRVREWRNHTRQIQVSLHYLRTHQLLTRTSTAYFEIHYPSCVTTQHRYL